VSDSIADLFMTLSLITAPFSGALKGAITEGESFSAAVGGWSGAMTKLGFASIGAGAVVAVASVKMAADFQSSMLKLVTSAGETQKNLKVVSDGVLHLAVQTGTSTDQLSQGLYMIESAGYHGAAGLEVLRASAQGARAEGADLNEVANAVTSALNAYHLPASKAVAVTDELVATVSAGKMRMQDLASSIANVLPVAAAAKISLSQVGGAIATMTAQGMSADQASQNLANTIRALQSPSLVAQQAMGNLGIDATDLSQNLGQRGLTGTLDLIYQAIMQHMGPGGLVLLQTFNHSKQAANDLNTMLLSMPLSVKNLATSLMNGGITASQFSKALKALPANQQVLGQQFETLYKKSQGFNSALKSGGQDATTFSGILSKVMGGATGLNTSLMLTGQNMSVFKGNVNTVSSAAAHAGKNVNGWAEITKSFNFTMSQLKEEVSTLAIRIGTVLIPIVQSVITFFMKHKSAAYALAAVIGTALVVAIGYATVAVWNFTAALLANPMTWIILGVAALIAAIVLLATHWKQVWGFIKRIAEDVGHFLAAIWDWLAGVVSHIWNDDIVAPIMDAWNTIAGFFEDAYHTVVDPIIAGWHLVERITSEVWNRISAFFRKWWPLLLAIFAPPIALIWGLWHKFHTQIENFAKAVWNRVSGFFIAVWNGIKTAALAVWHVIYQYVVAPVEQIYKDVVKIWDAIAKWIGQQWNKLVVLAAAIWKKIHDSVIKPVEQIWNDVTGWFKKIGDSIGTALDNAWHSVLNIGDKFMDIGKNIVMGIVHGVEHAGGSLLKSVKGLANDALHSVTNFLGIGSPSKVFSQEVGVWIPAGIADGVTRNAAEAHRAVTKLAGGMVSAASGSVLSIPSRVAAVAPAGGLTSGGGTPIGSVSGATVVNYITVEGMIESTKLADAIQTAQLRKGARNSKTFQSYKQARGLPTA
jgi:TP901 family phage tail tape measure protein